jgi:hypothetical protein
METQSALDQTRRRREAINDLINAACALFDLGNISCQRKIDDMFTAEQIGIGDFNQLQIDWNGVRDHLEALIDSATSIRDHADNHPDNHDRDAGRHCASCQHDLEQDADFRCVRCGTPS